MFIDFPYKFNYVILVYRGPIPDGDTGIFRWHHPSGRTMGLELT
jgi:hypothetical protein